MSNFLVKLISTFFFIGFVPFIPGTAASLAALFLIFVLKSNPSVHFLLFLAFLTASFFTVTKAAKIFKKKDPPQVVIDEVCGMYLSLLFLPLRPEVLFCAFILFRGFDTLKIFPANRLEKLSGANGIVLDDLVAGLYANLILQFVLRFAV